VILHFRDQVEIAGKIPLLGKSLQPLWGRLSRARWIPALVIVAILLSFFSCAIRHSEHSSKKGLTVPLRIVSFAPSITETLFALGLGDRVVGVTRFCSYPPEAQKIAKVGGYVDPNFEMILGLKPDLVLMLKEHGLLQDFLKKNTIRYQVIENEKLDDIIASFSKIGALCGVAQKGDSIAAQIRSDLAGGGSHDITIEPRVLFCIGRDNPGSGQISKLFAAGPNTFYDALIKSSGAKNACTDSRFTYPELSAEGIIRMQPEVVIDIMPSIARISTEKTIGDWNGMNMVPAVRSHCVYCLSNDYATIPGPRIVLLLRDIRRIIAEAREKKRMKGEG
jgi:iron complex transport system substrate-binding protein